MSAWYGQIGQDKFVVDVLKGKRHGTFLDVGCHEARNLSNTWYLEKELGWRGIAVDCDPAWMGQWAAERPGSVFVLGDACRMDYPELLAAQHLSQPVDYLSLDLEPPEATWRCLQYIMGQGVRFNVVTFETDFYRYQASRDPSRELMASLGYDLVCPGVHGMFGEQDDFYVHRSLT